MSDCDFRRAYRLTGGAATIALALASPPCLAAGLSENSDWNFGSASSAAVQNQILLEQLRQQKQSGAFGQAPAPITNIQVDSQTSQSIGNLNQISVTGSSGATVSVGQTNRNSTQDARTSAVGSPTQNAGDLTGSLQNVMTSR